MSEASLEHLSTPPPRRPTASLSQTTPGTTGVGYPAQDIPVPLSFTDATRETVQISAPSLPAEALLTVQTTPWVGKIPWTIVHGPSPRHAFALGGLEGSKTYFARARCGTGAWSQVQSFRTEGGGEGEVEASEEMLLMNPACQVFHGPRVAMVVSVDLDRGGGAGGTGAGSGDAKGVVGGGNASKWRDRADALASGLETRLGFKLVRVTNPTLSELRDAVVRFGAALGRTKGAVSAFVFAGRCVSAAKGSGAIHLLPADATVFTRDEAPFEGLPLSTVHSHIAASRGSAYLVAVEMVEPSTLQGDAAAAAAAAGGTGGGGAGSGEHGADDGDMHGSSSSGVHGSSSSSNGTVHSGQDGAGDGAAAVFGDGAQLLLQGEGPDGADASSARDWAVRGPSVQFQGAQLVGSPDGLLLDHFRAALESPRLTLTEIVSRARAAYEKSAGGARAGGSFVSTCDTKIRLL